MRNLKKRYKPIKLFEKYISYNGKEIRIGVYRTVYLYDVIIFAEENILEDIRDNNKLDSMIIRESIFGEPMIVWDTSDTEDDARYLLNKVKLK